MTQENAALREKNKKLEDKLEKTSKELEQTNKKLNEVLRRLAYYENPHTPPSQRRLKAKAETKSSGGKRGAPYGHKGVTRQWGKIDREIPLTAEECPECGSKNIEEADSDDKIIDEIPDVKKKETIKFLRPVYKCNDCGADFIAEDKSCPKEGIFGVNLMVLVVLLKFLPRAVLRRIVELLRHMHSLDITPASVNTVISRVAKAADKEYENMMRRVRRASKVYVDETSFSVLGKKWWVWIFRTDYDSLIVIRPSRGSKVLLEVLGKKFSGVVICDGWNAYNSLPKAIIQRCWAHLLREAKAFKDSIEGEKLYKELKLIFEEMKSFISSEPDEAMRREKYADFTKRLECLIEDYRKHTHLRGIIRYFKNGGEKWFTCVLYEGVEPTNNFAEQSLREHVIVRKIIGAFRSEKGVIVYEKLASLIATWRLNDANIPENLREMIIRNMCVSS